MIVEAARNCDLLSLPHSLSLSSNQNVIGVFMGNNYSWGHLHHLVATFGAACQCPSMWILVQPVNVHYIHYAQGAKSSNLFECIFRLWFLESFRWVLQQNIHCFWCARIEVSRPVKNRLVQGNSGLGRRVSNCKRLHQPRRPNTSWLNLGSRVQQSGRCLTPMY